MDKEEDNVIGLAHVTWLLLLVILNILLVLDEDLPTILFLCLVILATASTPT
jgi:hypothetical protein